MVAGTGKSKVGLYASLEGREFESTDGALHVTLQGSTSTGLQVPITFSGDVAEEAGVAHTESTTGTTTILAAAGTGVDTEIRYFGVWNKTTNSRVEYELRLGSTIVARGGLAAQVAFNANLIGAYGRGTNKAIVGYLSALDATATVVWSVRYKEI